MPVMLLTVLGVMGMSDERFRDEIRYQVSLFVAKAMLRKGLILEEEFDEIAEFLLKKYAPLLGALFVQQS